MIAAQLKGGYKGIVLKSEIMRRASVQYLRIVRSL